MSHSSGCVINQDFQLAVVVGQAVANGGEQPRRKAAAVDQDLRAARRLHEHGVAVAHIKQPDMQFAVAAAQ